MTSSHTEAATRTASCHPKQSSLQTRTQPCVDARNRVRASAGHPSRSQGSRWPQAGLAIAIALLIASPSLASENLVLIPDYALFGLFGEQGLGQLWVMLIGFVVLIFPLNVLLFQPIFRALDARAERIAGARIRSAQLSNEADQVLDRYENAIRAARAEAEAARQAQLVRAREEQVLLTTQARRESDGELERARADLGRSLEAARDSLRASAADLATSAAEQVLGRTLS